MVLAELCDGAEDGVMGKPTSDDIEPPSDDSNTGEGDAPGSDASDGSEEEEEVECLHPTSLVDVILEGASDLLTLEEAYTSLTLRLRESVYEMGPATLSAHASFDQVYRPILDEAPAIVRAMQRDLHRLMGRVPNTETDQSSSPFRGLVASSPSQYPPSPVKSPRKGYTAAEVMYRREAAGVGCSVLRFLACIFNSPRMFVCFTEADLLALLDQVLVIFRSPSLPTPSPKRTYTLAMIVLSQLNLPAAWVRPMEKKVVASVELALNSVGLGQNAIKDPSPIRKEAFNAMANLLAAYPDVFFSSYQSLLPICLRSLAHNNPTVRRSASAAAAAFVSSKLRLLENADLNRADTSEWTKTRAMVAKSETFVSNFLKAPLKVAGKLVYDSNGDKKTEWSPLQNMFRQTVGSADEVAWACSTWAMLVSLMGHAYNTSSQVQEIDHIMDRSLQPSTNSVRPTLASAAWQHAIYAYLQAGSSVTVTDDARIVRSYNAFAASSQQDVASRLKAILLPANLALKQANDSINFTRSLVAHAEFNGEQRWSWQRGEKNKRLAWMVTCGMSAPAMVYAYTVVALSHEDVPAREVSRVSGLPSSDGMVNDQSPEERSMPRLDRTFELILNPLLKQFFSINGVDLLKNQGWQILEAITAPAPATGLSVPPLERLLFKRYLSGEVLGLDKVTPEVIRMFEADQIKASEIPAWGKAWVSMRLGKLLSLFQDAFDGIRGISDLAAVEWVTNADGLVILPATLSRVWANLLRALAAINTPDSPNPLFPFALKFITQHILNIFTRDPASFVPVCLLNSSGKSTLNSDAVRLGVTLHLYNTATEVLGEGVFSTTRIDVQVRPGEVQPAFIDKAFGNPTPAGCILGQVLRSKLFTSPMEPKVRSLFQSLIGTLLADGSAREVGTRLLGEVTNGMPWIFEATEEMHLDVWRLVALKWADVIDLQPSDTVSQTNHTGSLLVSLLSCPFRSRDAASVWYSAAPVEALEAWDALLKVTVLRFRAKRAGSNLGVLETLSAHLGDFIRVDNDDEDSEATRKRRASATALHCLAAGTSWITLVPTEHYHASHFSINENYVPSDFFALVDQALCDAYSLDVAPAAKLIDSLTTLFSALPPDSVADVLDPLRPSLRAWMGDAECRISGDLGDAVDNLYIAVLGALTRAIEAGAIEASSEAMDAYIDMYAPRLSRAQSRVVPLAFRDMWHRAFQPLGAVDYSDDVAGFLQDVLTAVPGLVIAEGLESLDTESQSIYPYAETLEPVLRAAEPEMVVEATPEPVEPVEPVEVMEEVSEEIKDVVEDSIEEVAEPEPIEVEEPEEPIEVPPPVVSAPNTRRRRRNAPEADDLEIIDAPPLVAPTPSTRRRRNVAAEVPAAPEPLIPSVDYDADVSQNTKATRQRRKSELIPQSSSPVEAVAATDDVFGPAAIPAARRLRRKTRRSKSDANVAATPVAPSSPLLVPTSTPVVAAGDDTIIAETDIESPEADADAEPFHTPTATPTPSQAERPSLFSSASRWLRKVPSLGVLFNAQQQHEHEADVAVPASSSEPDAASLATKQRRKRRRESAFDEGIPEEVTVSRNASPSPPARDGLSPTQLATPVVPAAASGRATRSVSRGKRTAAAEEPPSTATARGKRTRRRTRSVQSEEEEDELLLSPQSAAEQRREEELSIAHAAQVLEAAAAAEASESGMFSDAPGDTTVTRTPVRRGTAALRRSSRSTSASSEASAVVPAADEHDAAPAEPDHDHLLPSPYRRTATQARVLAMVQEASNNEAAIANMDIEGVTELMATLDRLRKLAEANIVARAQEASEARRRKRQRVE